MKASQVPPPFQSLQPELILQATEYFGLTPTGRVTQLNSYENRVYDVELEEPDDRLTAVLKTAAPQRVILKFYRPGRWPLSAIVDEHEFISELAEAGIGVCPPLRDEDGRSAVVVEDYICAAFPKARGRMPQELQLRDFSRIGAFLARLHNVGSQRPAPARPIFSAETWGASLLPGLEPHVPMDFWRPYCEIAEFIFAQVEHGLSGVRRLRIHGDMHRGNILDDERELIVVDFDDFSNGPEIQDFWMLLSGTVDTDEVTEEIHALIDGYSQLRAVPDQWHLMEPLRGLRIINYSGWIAARWNDPFFPQTFPQFPTYNHWAEELQRLESLALRL